AKSKFMIPALLAALKDESYEVRIQAASGINAVLDERSITPLIEALKDVSGKIRKYALLTLYQIKSERTSEAIDALLPFLNDNDAHMRATAILAIGNTKSLKAYEVLMANMKNNKDVLPTIVALGRHGDKRAVEVIIPHLSTRADLNAIYTYKALEEIGPDWRKHADLESAAKKMAAGNLSSNDPNLRKYAAWALGVLSHKSALEPLVNALTDKDITVAKSAISALWKIDADWLKSEPGKAWLKQINNSMKSDINTELAKNARLIYSNIGDSVKEILVDFLQNSDKNVRGNAALALSAIGDARSIKHIISLLDDENYDVKIAAINAIGESKSYVAPEVVARIINMLPDTKLQDAAFSTLLEMGDYSTDELVKAIRNGPAEIRKSAIMILTYSGKVNNVYDKLIDVLPKLDGELQVMLISMLVEIRDVNTTEPLKKVLTSLTEEAQKMAIKFIEDVSGIAIDTDAPEWAGIKKDEAYYDDLVITAMKNIAAAESTYNAKWEKYSDNPKDLTSIDVTIPAADGEIKWSIDLATETEFKATAQHEKGSKVFFVDQKGVITNKPRDN
ncbi:HEAT repeat domain-containing protein, partial [Thermodesulfobacteriota bacterium]